MQPRCYSDRTGPRAAGHRFARSSLPYAGLKGVPPAQVDDFEVGATREDRVVLHHGAHLVQREITPLPRR